MFRIALPRAWARFKGGYTPRICPTINRQRNRGVAAHVERGSVREGQGLRNYDMARARLRWCLGWRGRGLPYCARPPKKFSRTLAHEIIATGNRFPLPAGGFGNSRLTPPPNVEKPRHGGQPPELQYPHRRLIESISLLPVQISATRQKLGPGGLPEMVRPRLQVHLRRGYDGNRGIDRDVIRFFYRAQFA